MQLSHFNKNAQNTNYRLLEVRKILVSKKIQRLEASFEEYNATNKCIAHTHTHIHAFLLIDIIELMHFGLGED